MRMTALVTCAALFLAPWPAQAHAHLVKSMPAEGSKLAAAPAQLQMSFSEAVQLTALSIQRADEPSPHKLAPLPGQESKQVAIDLPPLAAGNYRVQWRALSADHHVASGALNFAVKGH